MSMRAAIFDEEINRLLRETSEALPMHYEIRLSLYNRECDLTLEDPRGDAIEVNTDDLDFARTLAEYGKAATEHAARTAKNFNEDDTMKDGYA